ncbi:hypothetical protein DYBT9275_00159 [Dyadobacter sp. CECT 9275]|uniref:Iron-regulated membrane protein n=1 Tax=Dyadobacter helix TaxID=2822344 RepID=A0A916J7U7_9BACT|nr:PepSY-associated TM helix domain-containing protein [Dyadobacter sp. CECT 9275]CAG4988793.1 hypothetical protein DYBT9275_00159 [Dyadobacter sp. CECT 9275]
MKKTLKTIASQLHLWLGVTSGLVVFIVAITGAILVFEEELEPLLYPSLYKVRQEEGEKRLSLDQLIHTVKARYPDHQLTRIFIEPDGHRTIITNLKRNKKDKHPLAVAINPYTGIITAEREEQSAFFPVVLQLHRYLCMGETGKVITGISCVTFLLVMLTGLLLWWPNRKNRKHRFRIKWRASFKRLNWDLHAVAGFYVLPFIFVIALTGLVWSYKWVNNLIYLTFDGMPPQKREAPINLSSGLPADSHFERIFSETNLLLPHEGKVTFTMPESDSLAITVSKSDDEAMISNVVSFLYFDKNNGSLISERLYENETKGFKARRVVFPIHTGSLLGWPTKLLALLAALVAATLPATGLLIWWGKRKKRKRNAEKLSVTGARNTTRPHVRPEMSLKKTV